MRSEAKCSEFSVWHGAYHVVVRGGSHFYQSPKRVYVCECWGGGGVRSSFNQNVREGQHFLLKKIPKFPNPYPSKEKTYLPLG